VQRALVRGLLWTAAAEAIVVVLIVYGKIKLAQGVQPPVWTEHLAVPDWSPFLMPVLIGAIVFFGTWHSDLEAECQHHLREVKDQHQDDQPTQNNS
jgi:hypothetical protein